MANPYYVHPGQDYGQGLSGLSNTFQQMGAQKRVADKEQAELARIEALKAGAVEAFQSQDPNVIMSYSLQNPEVSKALNAAMGFRNQQTKDSYINSMFEVLQDPTKAGEVAKKRQAFLRSQGVPPEQTVETDTFMERWDADPEGMKRNLEMELAFRAPDKYKSYSESREAGMPGGGKDVPKQKTGAFLVRDKDGKTSVAVGSFDTSTGKLTTETASFDGFDVVSKLGETGKEESARKVDQKRGEVGAAGEEKRASGLIDRGIAAAESTATLRRAISLLDNIETGGIAAAKYAAKRMFGVEGADEGELSNSLGKAVLSQLRETFGAQFTESEGRRLERIEASFSKSPAANKRLLTQVLRIAERTAKRARKAAEKRGDQEAVDDIDDLLEFRLAEPDEWAAKNTDEMTDDELRKAAGIGGQ